jgi:NADH:ubiquinone oxidoreductase subunit 6 (subunit J)
MMLEIKMVNVSERFRDMFSYRNIVAGFLLLEVLLLSTEDVLDVGPLISFADTPEALIYFREANIYVDYSKLIQPTDHIRGVGGVLFTEYRTSLLVAALLLFLSMIGSIVLTLEESSLQMVKGQDANQQAIKHPALLRASFQGRT